MINSRRLLGVPLAAAITFGLFVLMRGLISGDEEIVQTYVQVEPIEIYKVRDDSDVDRGDDDIIEEVELPPEVERPEPSYEPREANTEVVAIGYEAPDPRDLIEGGLQGSCGVPIVRVPPNYPENAARKGIEGWVTVRFTVNEYGQVSNVHVFESDPPGVFDKAAINAVKKWKYNPCKGEGATTQYLEVVLNFELE